MVEAVGRKHGQNFLADFLKGRAVGGLKEFTSTEGSGIPDGLADRGPRRRRPSF